MAYDRYDEGRERGWRGSDRHHHRDREHRREGGEDRGWFERAGDEISSWFGDDRGHHGREHDSQQESGWFGNDRDRDRGYGRDYDRDREQNNWRGSDRDSGRPMHWTSSESDYRSGSGRGGRGYDRDDERAYGSRYSGGGSDRDEDRGYRPITGRYAASGEDYGSRGGYDRSESDWRRDDYRRTSYAGSTRDEDRHYRAWRDRQSEELDRDYQDYCRERGERFESDFTGWRDQRQSKRQMLGRIREHMDVVGRDGERIGKVDCVRGDKIILTKGDSEDGRHHSITCSMIDSVEGDQVRLDCSSDEAKRRWRDEDRERALFEREDQGRDGPHTLERSFHGTYR